MLPTDPDNTQTPWVSWGSGIRPPLPEDPDKPTHNATSRAWGFPHIRRRDVDQVDLTALMAALSGTKWPGNNVGIVPTDVLQADGRRVAEMALGNARGIMHQFAVKEGEFVFLLISVYGFVLIFVVDLKSKHRLLFSPFPDLSVISHKASTAAQAQVAEITAKMEEGDFADAEQESKELAALALRGIDFYDTFDQNRLKLIVTSGYVSFALYTLIYTVETYGLPSRTAMHFDSPSPKLDVAIAGVATGIVGLFVLEKTPWYCLYASFPLFFIRCLLQHWDRRTGGLREHNGMREVVKVAASAVASLVILFYMAVSDL